MTALLGVSSLAVDYGYLRLANAQIGGAVDAAALAGVEHLDGTQEGVDIAKAVAVAVGNQNSVLGGFVLTADMVELGSYVDGFSALPDVLSEDELLSANALRVNAENSGVTALLSRVLGVQQMRTAAQSTAVRETGGASTADCFIPIGLPTCAVEDIEFGVVQNFDFVFNGADDDAWYIFPDGECCGAQALRDQISFCSFGEAGIGDPVELNGGTKNSVRKHIVDVIEGQGTLFDPSRYGELPAQDPCSELSPGAYGYVYEGPMLVFESDDGDYCGGNQGTGDGTVIGIAWGAVYDLNSQSGKACKDKKGVQIRVDAIGEHDLPGAEAGGPDYGVLGTSGAVLVQ